MTNLSRRQMLGNAAGVLGGAGMAALSRPAPAHALVGTGNYNVRDYGARGDGVTNDTVAIQAAVTAAATSGGGVVYVPPGTYLVRSPGISITTQIALVGAGWETPTGLTRNGSYLHTDDPATNILRIGGRGRGTMVRDLAFSCAQPSASAPGFTPGAYPYAVTVSCDDVLLENLFLYNNTRGIYVGTNNSGNAVGRVTLNRIWGQPLATGILIDNALDICRVHDVHFWPFFAGPGAPAFDYVRSNGTALVSMRNDNPFYSDIFAYGYRYGMKFSASTGSATSGITSKFHLSNADLDLCGEGLTIDGANTTGQITNFTTQGDASSSVGLFIAAPEVKVQATNVRCTTFAGNAIRVERTNSFLQAENVFVEDWNRSRAGFPGVEGFNGGKVYLGFGRVFGSGNGAPAWGGNVVLDT